jgi:hypothetical protein
VVVQAPSSSFPAATVAAAAAAAVQGKNNTREEKERSHFAKHIGCEDDELYKYPRSPTLGRSYGNLTELSGI